MTGLEFQIAFGTELNQQGYPLPVDSEDIFYWLNKAQNYFIESLFDPEGREGFEESQRTVDALSEILKKSTMIAPSQEVAPINGQTVRVTINQPEDYLWLISVYAKEVEGKFIRCKFRHSDKLQASFVDPFHRPSGETFLYGKEGNKVAIYYPSKNFVTEAYLTYIRLPKEIIREPQESVSCELPEFLHYKIVDVAVKLYLDSLRHKSYYQRGEQPQTQ